jgi:hypothetical protein
LSKVRKDHTEIELDSIGHASARNAENKTKLESIVRSLTNNKRLRASYVLITKSCGKNISEKYSLLELNKVTFNYRKHDKPNHILLIDI